MRVWVLWVLVLASAATCALGVNSPASCPSKQQTFCKCRCKADAPSDGTSSALGGPYNCDCSCESDGTCCSSKETIKAEFIHDGAEESEANRLPKASEDHHHHRIHHRQIRECRRTEDRGHCHEIGSRRLRHCRRHRIAHRHLRQCGRRRVLSRS